MAPASTPVLRSVTAALDEIGFGKAQALLLCYCGLAWLADACETMLLSFLGPSVRCYWGAPAIGAGAESLLSSVVFAGMLVGVQTLGAVADHLGRRRGFLLSALLLGAAGLASACAPSFAWLLALRGLVGFALGGTPVVVTLFAELCPSAGRGRWLLVLQSFWTLGTMLEVLLAWAVLPRLGWRWLLALSAAPLGLLLACYPLLPESPVWLASQGRHAEAEAVLQRLAAANGAQRPLLLRLAPGSGGAHERAPAAGGAAPAGVRSRGPAQPAAAGPHASPGARAPLLGAAAVPPLQDGRLGGEGQRPHAPPQQPHLHGDGECASPVAAARRQGGGGAAGLAGSVGAALATVFGPQLRTTTVLLFGIWAVNAATYYGLVLLTTALQTAAKRQECTPAGGPNLDGGDYSAILLTTLAEAPGLLAAGLLVDSRGRRWTLGAGLAGCCAALAALLGEPPRGGQLALLFVARGCIEGTFSCLYVLTPEVYPTRVRSVGLALCNAFSRLGGCLAPFLTVALVQRGQPHAAEALLAGLCGGAAAAAFLLPLETRGRDLQAADLAPCHADSAAAGDAAKQRSSDTDEGSGAHGAAVGAQRRSADGELELEPPHEEPPGRQGERAPLLPT